MECMRSSNDDDEVPTDLTKYRGPQAAKPGYSIVAITVKQLLVAVVFLQR